MKTIVHVYREVRNLRGCEGRILATVWAHCDTREEFDRRFASGMQWLERLDKNPTYDNCQIKIYDDEADPLNRARNELAAYLDSKKHPSRLEGEARMITWKPVTEDRFYKMLGVLPPASRGGAENIDAFQVGEAYDSDGHGRWTFQTFKMHFERQSNATVCRDVCLGAYQSERALTFAEFQAEFPGAEYYYR